MGSFGPTKIIVRWFECTPQGMRGPANQYARHNIEPMDDHNYQPLLTAIIIYHNSTTVRIIIIIRDKYQATVSITMHH